MWGPDKDLPKQKQKQKQLEDLIKGRIAALIAAAKAAKASNFFFGFVFFSIRGCHTIWGWGWFSSNLQIGRMPPSKPNQPERSWAAIGLRKTQSKKLRTLQASKAADSRAMEHLE